MSRLGRGPVFQPPKQVLTAVGPFAIICAVAAGGAGFAADAEMGSIEDNLRNGPWALFMDDERRNVR